jgi:hypothetical protein
MSQGKGQAQTSISFFPGIDIPYRFNIQIRIIITQGNAAEENDTLYFLFRDISQKPLVSRRSRQIEHTPVLILKMIPGFSSKKKVTTYSRTY